MGLAYACQDWETYDTSKYNYIQPTQHKKDKNIETMISPARWLPVALFL